jgi:Leucine-rich repeat (LRR) protein
VSFSCGQPTNKKQNTQTKPSAKMPETGKTTFTMNLEQDITAAFTDENFKAFCLKKFDTDNDGKLQVKDVCNIPALDVSENEISSLAGIEYFTALTELDCHENKLTALDVSKNAALKELDCSNNQLTALDITQNTALLKLHCYKNRLTTLDVSKNETLMLLYCNNNALAALDISKNNKLTSIACTNNSINPKIIYVWFLGNVPENVKYFEYDDGVRLEYKT